MRKVLIVLIVILSLILTSLLGFIWYQSSHIFVDGEAYAKNAQELDLRGTDLPVMHILTVQAQLPDCKVLWDVPFQGAKHSSDTTQMQIETLQEVDIDILQKYFPELTRIDATACKDYGMLELLKERLPQCELVYQVDLGGTMLSPDAAEVTLQPGAFDFDTLIVNLVHLPNMQTIYFPNAEVTPEQMDALAQGYPDIVTDYSVEILGVEYDLQTTQLDLSALTPDQIDQVASKLSVLTSLEQVELMDANGASQLSMEDVKKLQEGAPNTVFHYTFDFYGIPISTTDKEVILKNIKITSDNFEEELRLVLDIMEEGDRFVLESRGKYDQNWKKIDNETLAQIREDYRDKTKMVWRVYFSTGYRGSSLTDAEVLRATYDLGDDNCSDLKYLEDCRYMDLGHCEFLDHCDFVSGMTSLEVVIVSGAPIKSLEPFAACKELKFLEIVECNYIPDLEPLRSCTKLEMLNISHTSIADISPVADFKLTHLNTMDNKVPEEDIAAYGEANPDCWIVTKGNHYGQGWRYDENDDPLPWYAKMKIAFKYPKSPNNLGWYLPDDFE